MPKVFIIGGANGSGKTTAAMVLLPKFLDVFEFVNADEIARGLNPLKPGTANIAAGKAMINRIQDLIKAKKDFAFETTCAGLYHIKTLKDCRAAGYEINLIYLWLPSEKMAAKRVKARVKQGGHSIPEDTIYRRYYAGLANLVEVYLPLVDNTLILDNSDLGPKKGKIIATKTQADGFEINIPTIWEQILAAAKQE